MTTPKTPLSLEWAVAEAMRRAPHGIGAAAVGAVLGKSPDMLYKATNEGNPTVSIWSVVTVEGLVTLSASLVAAGVHDYIMPALTVERDRRAEAMRGAGDLDNASSQMLCAVAEVMSTLAKARDPSSPSGTGVGPCEGVALLAALQDARGALDRQICAVVAAVGQADGRKFPT